jgi:CRISPR-associated protein Cmr6
MSEKVTRREKLHEALKGFKPSNTTNISVWLDKYIVDATHEDKESRAKFAGQVSDIDAPDEYEKFFGHWETALKQLGAICRRAEVENRMAIGLGTEGVLETSVALHRTYGVPYIPGSALKGLAAAFARHYCGDDWQQGKPFHRTVFGTTEEAGYVTFFDALYVPGSGYKVHGKNEPKALHFDVMTVHHRPYYERKQDAQGNYLPPADWDDPTPVPFISATGMYLIALAAPEGCEAWRDVAFLILEKAFEHEGVGAKTSSGYGRMKFVDQMPVDADKSVADAMIQKVAGIPASKLPNELGEQAVKLINSTIKAQHKKRVAEEINKRIADSEKKQRKRFEEKDWFARLQGILTG